MMSGAVVRLYGTDCAWKLGLGCREIFIELTAILNRAFDTLPDKTPFETELTLVRDLSMIAYNRSGMHCTGPTNILSFPPVTDNSPLRKSVAPAVGSLVLSVDAVLRESLLFKKNIKDHLLLLFAHGIGHLMGFDHSPEMFIFCDNIAKK